VTAQGPVLLWGWPRDTPMAAVCTALSRRGVPMFFVDQTRAAETEIAFDAASGEGFISVGGQRCELGQVRSAYLRPDASARLDAAALADPGGPAAQHAAAIDDALASWLELTPVPVVNRLTAMASNGSKPYQSTLIRRAGFVVPETLLTTSAQALRGFHARHQGQIIYKSCSSVRSIVSRLARLDGERLARLATCPTQFQPYIPGPEFRVHVIGSQVFGHRITTEADDYRYAGADGSHIEGWDVPKALASRLRALAASLALSMAGIDLRRTKDGRWLCFEVNPAPGFTFFDQDDDMPMAAAAARLLEGA
jgi:glutathione synthase/RimK-type ligase-like ATP-grasp enzyme